MNAATAGAAFIAHVDCRSPGWSSRKGLATMRKNDLVTLTQEERTRLSRPLTSGTAASRTLTPARILPKADQGPEGYEPLQPAVLFGRPVGERARETAAAETTILAREHVRREAFAQRWPTVGAALPA